MTRTEQEQLDSYQERLEQEKYFEQLAIEAATKEEAMADHIKEKQMTAKEMFEALGFKQTTGGHRDLIYRKPTRIFQDDQVVFDRFTGQYYTGVYSEELDTVTAYLCIGPKLHAAIHQQQKEFGYVE